MTNELLQQSNQAHALSDGRLSGVQPLQQWLDFLRRVRADDDDVAAARPSARRRAFLSETALQLTLLASVVGAVAAVFAFKSIVGAAFAAIVAAPFLFLTGRQLTRSAEVRSALDNRRLPGALTQFAAAIVERLAPDVGPDALLDLEVQGSLIAVRLTGADGVKLELDINDIVIDGDRRQRQIGVTVGAAGRDDVRIDRVVKTRDTYPLFNAGTLTPAAWARMVDEVVLVVEAARSRFENRAFRAPTNQSLVLAQDGVPTAAMVKRNHFGGSASAANWLTFITTHRQQLGSGTNRVSLAIVAVAGLAAWIWTPFLLLPAFAIVVMMGGTRRGPEAQTILEPLLDFVVSRFGADTELRIELDLQQRPTLWSSLKSFPADEVPRERAVLTAEIWPVVAAGATPVGIRILVADVELITKRTRRKASGKTVEKVDTRRVRLLRATTVFAGEPITRAVRVKRPSQTVSGAPELIELIGGIADADVRLLPKMQ